MRLWVSFPLIRCYLARNDLPMLKISEILAKSLSKSVVKYINSLRLETICLLVERNYIEDFQTVWIMNCMK